ncbi:universal stress protein [Paractinoplanes atraurantiacus]|uniref:Nucleotide-binding universal stress protein, UspA family n=1 Tax=Paractinoplanes atraurantiacus TaxID=1036182 RepID=A0A285JGC6_9ACTN|nr:universal stress protein [Actinoplanes atraurantiacus]SNY59123.1 Nucleotide-binding universal stress protein, UspA family [Actinoplanes atraurantiacus]
MNGPGILLGYEGSVPAGAAIEVAARLLPGAHARVAYVWTPPFASEALRRRLWHRTAGVDEFVAAVEREGESEARRIAAMGVAFAAPYGWRAEPVVRRTYGGEGVQLCEVAEELGADLIVVGSRGLTGARAVLGSVSDMVVHFATRPVLVVPHPLLEAQRAVLDAGPVLLGWDGSAGARAAQESLARLLPRRAVVPVRVEDGDEPSPQTIPGLVKVPPAGGHLERGRAVAAALTGQAGAVHAAVLAVGSRGRSAVREIVLGSVAMAALHHAYRPVLVVPHHDTE